MTAPALLDTSKVIVGASGSGKTVTAKADVEQLLADRRHTAVIDPTGVWWGMRSSVAGDGPGFDLPIFGGAHGDIAIAADQGGAIAEILLEQRVSAIVDLSAIDNSRDWRAFMNDFVAGLRRGVAGNFHLVVDEADEFAAERPADDIGFRLRENLIWIAKRGRAQGFVPTWITQRTAEIAKAVISQAQTIVAHQLIAPTDRKAIDDYLKGHADAVTRKQVMGSLAELAVGERWIYSPRLGVLDRGTTPPLTTFDSSRTPAPGEQLVQPRTFADLDVSAIREALAPSADYPDDAVPADPAEALVKGGAVGTLLRERDDRIANLESANRALEIEVDRISRERDAYRGAIDTIEDVLVATDRSQDDTQSPPAAADRPAPEAKDAPLPKALALSPQAGGASDLIPTALAVAELLKAVAPDPLRWNDALLLAGRRPGSGDAGKARAQLLEQALIECEGDQCRAAAPLLRCQDIAVGHWPGGDELVDLWAEKLRGPGGDILRYLAKHGSRTKEQIGRGIGKSATSGWFGKGMKDLRRSNLVREAGGKLELHDALREGI